MSTSCATPVARCDRSSMTAGSTEIGSVRTIVAWLASLSAGCAALGRYYATLSCGERERAARFRCARERERYIASHGILRRIIAVRIGCAPHDPRFVPGKFGKPMLEGWTLSEPIHFNLSRSGDLMLLAISTGGPVGADIEVISPGDIMDLAETVCSVREREMLRALPSGLRQRYFFRLWTRKEAAVKALGAGLSISPANVDVRLPGDRKHSHRSSGAVRFRAGLPDGCDCRWGVRDISTDTGYAAAISAEGCDWYVEFRRWPGAGSAEFPLEAAEPGVSSIESGG